MKSYQVIDVKLFMSKFLKQSDFDTWLIQDIELLTQSLIKISGKINKDYFSNDELELMTEDYLRWGDVKPQALAHIKGHRQPTKMKFVLTFPFSQLPSDYDTSNIESLTLNIVFENQQLNIISGMTPKSFTLDKSLEILWDDFLQHYIQKIGIAIC